MKNEIKEIPVVSFKMDYKKSWEKAVSRIYDKDKEIERLNNIINELDDKLCSTWQLYYDHSRLTTFKCEDMLYLIEQIRKDINELKEGK